jgi:MinD superfamily P-loop ATPase
MKQLAVVSGKGGTGKTTVTAALSILSTNKVLVDCDVDASNLHLILNPEIQMWTDFYSGKAASINPALCTKCGICIDTCRFDAINRNFEVEKVSCEGCGACEVVCPENAVSLYSNHAGKWFMSNTDWGTLIHAELGIAEDNSGKLVSCIRQKAESVAEQHNNELIIIDGPPGIGCPVIASITGVDHVLITTEPTQSGLHDALRVKKVAENFNISCSLCINKSDLNLEMSEQIKEECKTNSIDYIGSIPFRNEVVDAMITGGHDFFNILPLEVTNSLKNIWEKLKIKLN